MVKLMATNVIQQTRQGEHIGYITCFCDNCESYEDCDVFADGFALCNTCLVLGMKKNYENSSRENR